MNRKYQNQSTKKTLVAIATVLVLVLVSIMIMSGCTNRQTNTIKINGAFALYPLMVKWTEEYQKLHSNITFDVQAQGAGIGMSLVLAKQIDIGMVSRAINQSEIQKGAFWVSVAKDAVIATININNPVIEDILKKGVTKEQFREIFINRSITTWGQLVGNDSITAPIVVYSRGDSGCGAAETWAKYLGNYKQGDLIVKADSAPKGDDLLAQAIVADENGIGYNNMAYVYDANSFKYDGKIRPVPIDLNGNGTLDVNENFYENRSQFVNAINNNIYPFPPARVENLAVYVNFSGNTKDFVRWILTDGQQYVLDAGYVLLPQDAIQQQISYLETGKRPEIP